MEGPSHLPPHLTWVLAATAPLDEADDEQDQHQKGDGTHEPDEPALGGDVCLVIGVSWQGGWEANHEPLLGEQVRRKVGEAHSYWADLS